MKEKIYQDLNGSKTFEEKKDYIITSLLKEGDEDITEEKLKEEMKDMNASEINKLYFKLKAIDNFLEMN